MVIFCLLNLQLLPGERTKGRRRDLNGEVLTASFDFWRPFCAMDPQTQGPVDAKSGRGIFPEIFATLGQALNFTPR